MNEKKRIIIDIEKWRPVYEAAGFKDIAFGKTDAELIEYLGRHIEMYLERKANPHIHTITQFDKDGGGKCEVCQLYIFVTDEDHPSKKK